MKSTETKPDIRLLSATELEAALAAWGEPAYRARQVSEWLWRKGAHAFDEMTNLSRNLRIRLQESYSLHHLQTDKVQRSHDGTIKTRMRLHDG